MDDDDAVVRKAALRVAWSIATITLLLVVEVSALLRAGWTEFSF